MSAENTMSVHDRNHVIMKRIAACTQAYHFLKSKANAAEAELTVAREYAEYIRGKCQRVTSDSVKRIADAAAQAFAIMKTPYKYEDCTVLTDDAARVWAKAIAVDASAVTAAVENMTSALNALKSAEAEAEAVTSAAAQFEAVYFCIYDAMKAYHNASSDDTGAAFTAYHDTVKEAYNAARYFLKSVGYMYYNERIVKLP